MKKLPLCVFSKAKDLREGLFGCVFYHTFMILPYLYERGIFPAWEIRSIQYGTPPDYISIPGALDISYTPPQEPCRRISLDELRRRHAKILGNDWEELSRIWHAYFTVPARIQQSANQIFPPGRVLGLHYRGNDKLSSLDDSNPISQEDFLTLVREFLATAPPFDVIFAATDDFSFVDKLRAAVTLPVINLGEVGFHKALNQTTPPKEKTDRALLDCVLLSRCSCVIETSSALPSFTKILNPNIEIYRTAASKIFRVNMPYFPGAYIPILPVSSPKSRAILDATLVSDWTLDSAANRFKKKFAFSTYRPLHHTLFTIAEKLGASDIITVHR
jgi:hypothetical protein